MTQVGVAIPISNKLESFMKLVTSTFLVVLAATVSTVGCEKKDAPNVGEKAASEKPTAEKPKAESEQDKAFEA